MPLSEQSCHRDKQQSSKYGADYLAAMLPVMAHVFLVATMKPIVRLMDAIWQTKQNVSRVMKSFSPG